jgi:hypothetical protein
MLGHLSKQKFAAALPTSVQQKMGQCQRKAVTIYRHVQHQLDHMELTKFERSQLAEV